MATPESGMCLAAEGVVASLWLWLWLWLWLRLRLWLWLCRVYDVVCDSSFGRGWAVARVGLCAQ